jgi:hypothetical protein
VSYWFWCKHTHERASSAPKFKWQLKTESRLFATPAIAGDGSIYVASYDVLHVLNPDGSEKWHYVPGTPLLNSPILGPDGSVYLLTLTCEAHALNQDGSKRWVSKIGYISPGVRLENTALGAPMCNVRMTPALTGSETMVVPNSQGDLWIVDLESGASLKRFPYVSGAGESSPAILSDGTILQGTTTNYGALNGVGPEGQVLWTVGSNRYASFGSPAVAGDGTIVISDSTDFLRAIDPGGATKWKLPGRWGSVPVIANTGTIFDGVDHQRFAAVGPDGTVKWTVSILAPSPAAIAEDGTIYLAGYEFYGKNFAFALDPDGHIKWKLPVIGPSEAGPTIAPDGTVYFVTQGAGSENAGLVYAIKESNGGLMKTGWPKFHRSLNNDGRVQSDGQH